MHALVISRAALDPQPVIALPEAPAGPLLHHASERSDDPGVTHSTRLRDPVVRRPGESPDSSGSLDRELVFDDHPLDGLPHRGRRSSFRESTSLMAAFSSARSAYIRFNFAFSASSSFIRSSSLTETPAQLDRQLK